MMAIETSTGPYGTQRNWMSYANAQAGNWLMTKGYMRVFNSIPENLRPVVEVAYGYDVVGRATIVKIRIAAHPSRVLERRAEWPDGGQFLLDVPITEEDIAFLCLVA